LVLVFVTFYKVLQRCWIREFAPSTICALKRTPFWALLIWEYVCPKHIRESNIFSLFDSKTWKLR
jgi:hypothetical protein